MKVLKLCWGEGDNAAASSQPGVFCCSSGCWLSPRPPATSRDVEVAPKASQGPVPLPLLLQTNPNWCLHVPEPLSGCNLQQQRGAESLCPALEGLGSHLVQGQGVAFWGSWAETPEQPIAPSASCADGVYLPNAEPHGPEPLKGTFILGM